MDKKYIGLDVHGASTTMVVLNDQGKLVHEAVMQTSGPELRSSIGSIRGSKELTLEEGTMSAWLYGLLRPLVSKLIVCDPAENRKIFRGAKNDHKDALHLAELLRGGYLKPVFHDTHPMEELRSTLRTYLQVTEDLVRSKNRLKALFRSRGVQTGSAVYCEDQREVYLSQLDRSMDRERALYLYEQIDFLEGQKERSGKELVSRAKKDKGFKILKSIPGLGPIQAAKVLGIGVTPERFRTRRLFWSYCGLSVIKRSSSDWVQGQQGLELRRHEQVRGLNPCRNGVMKEVFKQAAVKAIQRPPFEQLYQRMIDRGLDPSIARVAVARKVAAVTLTLWKKGELFDTSKIEVPTS